MAGAKHGIIGNNSFIADMPQTQVPKEDLVEERKLANVAKSPQFQQIKEHFQSRVEYYQKYLPDGRNVMQVDLAELGQHWVVANAMVAEFNLLINTYERALETVTEAEKVTSGS